jgi:hypothetical protein
MSDYIGFLVVSRKDGYLLEGKDHAAKVFERRADAQSACGALQNREVVRLRYDVAVQSLMEGSAFSFDCQEGLERFQKKVRNDMAHKPYLAKSQDHTLVRWKESDARPAENDSPGARMVSDAAAQAAAASQPSVETPKFNPAILVPERNQ